MTASTSITQGRRKAALLLLALGPEAAAKVMRELDTEEVELLSIEAASQPPVDGATMTQIAEEALAAVRGSAGEVAGGFDYVRSILERALDSQTAAHVMERVLGAVQGRPFDFLRHTPPEQIHAFLRGEAPQIAALVIALLPKQLAARVLAQFGEEEQPEIAHRMASMSETSPDVVSAIEDVVRSKVAAVVAVRSSTLGGVNTVAEILNEADRPTERNVLQRMESLDPGVAEQIRALLFTFEDLAKLDDRNIQLILREVDQKDLALALRGVAPMLRDRVFANMSERGAEMLRDEIEVTPPQRRQAVEDAQRAIVAVVRRLDEQGVLVLGRGGGDDDLVI